ncbi:MAG: adenylate kinase family protein [Halobaculum sp.]
MRVAVTGTPGVGKTTATEQIEYPVVHLNDAVRTEGLTDGHDDERDSLVVDLDAAASYVAEREAAVGADDGDDDPAGAVGADDGDEQPVLVVESHLAHQLPADRVVVLRCRPDVIEQRLLDRGETEATAAENRESEALDLIVSEAVDRHGEDSVYEIDATDAAPAETAAGIEAVIAGEREPSAGEVSFLQYR